MSAQGILKDGTILYADEEPWILTGEESTEDKLYGIYNIDVKDQMVYEGSVREGKKKKFYVAIRPQFFAKYSRGMPNSIIYLASCQLLYNDKLSNMLIDVGAKAVIGFDENVFVDYAHNIGATFFKSMTDGKNVEEAFFDATAKHGAEHAGAKFKYSGEKNLVLEFTGIRNGGFEKKLESWETAGDVRPI